ncbi:MAG: hypothetical protein WBO29_01950 [Albidovulum sp.]
MPALKVDANTILKRKLDEPVSYQIYDCFEDYFPKEIEARLRNLNQTFPLAGLHAQIDCGQITKGQWLLYTTVCFTGQVLNGGTEQFFDNCPGLILDVRAVLKNWAPEELLTTYQTAARSNLEVIEAHSKKTPKAEGADLADFWKELEAAGADFDDDAVSLIDASAYSDDRDSNPLNWFTSLETNVLDFVVNNPTDFKRAS